MSLGSIRVGGFGWTNEFGLTLPPLVLSLIVVGLAGGVIDSIKEASQIDGRLERSIVVEQTINFP